MIAEILGGGGLSYVQRWPGVSPTRSGGCAAKRIMVHDEAERRDGEECGMRSGIAVIMAILGVLLVLGGGTTLWAAALVRSRSAEAVPAGSRFERGLEVASRLPGAERLITWGVVLLALSAIAAGAITFSATATTGSN